MILAVKQIGEQGQTAWFTTSFRSFGSDANPRNYWIEDGEFRRTPKQTVDETGHFTFLASEVFSDPNEDEREAISKGISEWSGREPDAAKQWSMTNRDRIAALLRTNRQVPFCDSCIYGQLALPSAKRVAVLTRSLSSPDKRYRLGFGREYGICSLCHKKRLVIQSA